jgi:hypothetical protein
MGKFLNVTHVGWIYIPHWDAYCCEVYHIHGITNPIANIERELEACPLLHPRLVKIFVIHPVKPKSYMCWRNVGSLKSMDKKLQKHRLLEFLFMTNRKM